MKTNLLIIAILFCFLQPVFGTPDSLNTVSGTAEAIRNKGLEYFKNGDIKKALQYYDSALVMFQSAGDDKNAAGMYRGIGRVFASKGDYRKAMKLTLKALEKFESLNDTLNIAATLINLGGISVYMKHYEKAIKYHSDAYDIFNKHGDTRMSSRCLTNIGNAYIAMNDTSLALKYYQKALITNKDSGDIKFKSYLTNNIGLVYEKRKQYENALDYYFRSLNLKKKINEKYATAETFRNIGNIFAKTEQFDSAYKYVKKAEEIATAIQAKELLQKCYNTLSKVYAAKGDYNSFLSAFNNYISLKDSIFNEENAKQIAEMQTRYETEKKEKENLLLKKDIELKKSHNERLIIWISLLGLIALLLIIILITVRKVHIQKRQLTEERNKNLKEQLDLQNRELAAKALSLAHQQELNVDILNDLKKLGEKVQGEQERKVLLDIANKLKHQNDASLWKEFEIRFANVHSGFYANLNKKFPQLTPNERKLCALLRLNMSSKDISSITFQSVRAVEVARYRLRKKLNLCQDDNLVAFLNSL